MKRKLLFLLCAMLVVLFAFTACKGDTVTELTIEDGTMALEYELGSTPDFSGVKAVVTYKNGNTETITADKLTISELDTSVAGEKTVSITYEGITISVKVTVKEAAAPVAPTLTSIKIVKNSVDTTVAVGSTLDTTGIKVEATYSDGSVKVLTAKDLTVTAPDTATAGDKTLTVTFEGKSDSLEIKVVGVKSIVVYDTYNKILKVNETFDSSKLMALVTFADNSTEIVKAADLTVGTVDTTTPGTKEITVSYLDGSTTINVEVIAVSTLKVNNAPASVMYGETYDKSGITALATYSNGSKVVLPMESLTFGNIDTTAVGTQTLTVTFDGVSDTVEVLVVGVSEFKVISGIEKEVLLNGEYSTANIKVTANFNDGTSKNLTKSDLVLGTVDTTTAGVKALSISYLNMTENFEVKVCGIKGIVTEGVPAFVTAGYTLDLSSMKVYLVYEDTKQTKVEVTTDFSTNADSLNFNEEGDKTLVVTYSGAFGTFTENVVISTTAPTLSSIAVTGYDKFVVVGRDYDEASVQATATYSNGRTNAVTLTAFTVDTSVAGNKEVTVSYTEGGITKEATFTVAVLPLSDIVAVTGLPTTVNFGADLDLSALAITVLYSDGTYTANETVTEGITVTGFDKNVAGDQTLTVAFGGVTTTASVHVKGVASISILTDIANMTVRYGYINDAINASTVEIQIVYTDGTSEVKTLSELGNAASVSIAEKKNYLSYDANLDGQITDFEMTSMTINVSVSYAAANGTFTAAAAEKQVLLPESVSALNGTVPVSVLKGQTPDMSTMRLTVVYTDGTNKFLYLVGNDDNNLSLTMPEFDPNTAGEYAVRFVFMGAEFTDTKFAATVVLTVRDVNTMILVPGSMSTTVEINKGLETEDIQIRVDYTDGSYAYLGIDNGITLNNVDTATAGIKTLTVTYLGKTLNIDITVIDTSAGVDQDGIIYGVTLPDELTTRDSYKDKFKDKTQGYVVGDDNPYYFYLKLLMLDDNDDIVNVDGKKFPSTANVYILENGSYRLLADDLATYVAVDAANNSYDFTEAAIGKTFKLEIAPDSVFTKPEFTRTHEVTVVDGYNIYNAWELNLITNDNATFASDSGELNQLTLARDFLATKMPDKTATEIANISTGMKGIVLHGNINITTADIPDGYMYRYNKNGTAQVGFYDKIEVFKRQLTKANPTFSMHGNYYTVYSYNLPCVVEQGYHESNDDAFSNAKLFSICCYEDFYTTVNYNFNHKDYHSYVQNIAFRDNDPNSNDQSASERHMRGLVCFRFSWHEANLYNTNIDAFYVSMVPEDDDLTINLNKVKFYNAWQGHMFIWNNNYRQERRYGSLAAAAAQPIPDSYQNIKINITDSLLGKCGGPVILSQSNSKQYAHNAKSGADIVVTDSELYSYVTGQEAWFVAVNQTAMAGQILGMNNLITGFSGGTASYLSDKKITGVNTMNMIMVNMGPGQDFTDRGYEGSYTSIKTDGNGNVVSQTTGLYMDNDSAYVLNQYKNLTGGQAPIFQANSENQPANQAGTCFYNGSILTPDNTNYAGAGCYTGEYITMYYMGMGIMLEYYNASNPDT